MGMTAVMLFKCKSYALVCFSVSSPLSAILQTDTFLTELYLQIKIKMPIKLMVLFKLHVTQRQQCTKNNEN